MSSWMPVLSLAVVEGGMEDGDDTREARADSKWALWSIGWSQLRLWKLPAPEREVISGGGGGWGSPNCQFRGVVVPQNLSFSISKPFDGR